MINNILNSTLNKASLTITDSKDKILAASKKKAEENININIPSPENFKNQLSGLASSSPEDLQKAEQVYNKTISFLEKAIKRLENSKQELESIQNNLNSVIERLNIFENIATGFEGLVSLFRIGLPISIDAGLAASSGPLANGTTINRLGDIKDKLKDTVTKFDNAINSFQVSFDFFNSEVNKLSTPLTQGILGIQNTIDQLKKLLEQLQAIWANFIISLNLPELQDIIDEDNGTTLEEYVSNPDNLTTIVEDLIIPLRKTYYEIRDEGPGTDLFETGIIEEPID